MQQDTDGNQKAYAGEPTDDSNEDVTSHTIGWVDSVRSRIFIIVKLATAEVKLAALSAAAMCFLAISAALLLLGAWGLVVAGLVVAMTQLGVALWAALMGLAVLHIAAAALLMTRAVSMSRHLNFEATRQQLAGDQS